MSPTRLFMQTSRGASGTTILSAGVSRGSLQLRALSTSVRPLQKAQPGPIGENEDPTIRGEDAKEPKGSKKASQKPEDKSAGEAQEHGSGSKGGPSTSGAAGHYKPSGGAAGGGKQGPVPSD